MTTNGAPRYVPLTAVVDIIEKFHLCAAQMDKWRSR